MYEDYKTDISFAEAEGTLLCNQLILGAFAEVEIDRFYSLLWRSETK